MINPTEMAVLSVIGHGGAKELLKNGFNWEWMGKGDAQKVVKEALTLELIGAPVNIASVMQHTLIDDWEPVLHAWVDGYGSDAAVIVAKVKYEHLSRSFGAWLKESERLHKDRQEDIHNWLPLQLAAAQDLSAKTMHYSPDPVDLARLPIPKIMGQFPSQSLNKLFSGGIWKPACVGIVSHTGGGKTTMTISVAANLCQAGIRNAIFSGERLPQWYIYRVMRFFGFSKEEFEHYSQEDDGSARYATFKEYLQNIATTLTIFDSRFMEPAKMKQEVRKYRPDVVQVDHILALRLEGRAGNEAYAIGKAAYEFLDMTNLYGCMGVMNGQLNGKDAETFKATHNLPFTNFFGSSIVAQSLVVGLLTCRDWVEPPVGSNPKQYFIKKKDSVDENGEPDSVEYMEYDPVKAAYVDCKPSRSINL